jgi:hypothetical protein
MDPIKDREFRQDQYKPDRFLSREGHSDVFRFG